MPRVNGKALMMTTVLAMILGIGAAIGTMAVYPQKPTTPRTGPAAGMVPTPVTTLDQAIATADVIALARIGELRREATEGPYGGLQGADDPRSVPRPGSLPFTYYTADVQEVIEGQAAVGADRKVILRVPGSAEAGTLFAGAMQPPVPGASYVLFLRQNPDGASFGTDGPWGFVQTSGETVRYANRENTPVEFARDMTPQEFVQLLKKRVRAR